jgi:hypothetical protein
MSYVSCKVYDESEVDDGFYDVDIDEKFDSHYAVFFILLLINTSQIQVSSLCDPSQIPQKENRN